jgi:L-cysteine:1D-myo-inositol 2-amino-2-deoxy-alpha-D-glucopyranoside ligase
MASEFLSQPVDIHGGGADLIFPHHECEIAQAEYASGQQPFARTWLHVAMLRYEGEKMSKSLGNLVMVRDLLEGGWSANSIRLLMARHHYREEWTFKEPELVSARESVERLEKALSIQGGTREPVNADGALREFCIAMDNDLDTPAAVAVLERLSDDIVASAKSSKDVVEAKRILREACSALGLRLDGQAQEDRVVDGWNRHLERFTD